MKKSASFPTESALICRDHMKLEVRHRGSISVDRTEKEGYSEVFAELNRIFRKKETFCASEERRDHG